MTSLRPAQIVPGTYRMKHVDSGKVIDLSGADDRTCIGFLEHGWENQRWIFARLGAGYSIQSAHSQQYMTIDASLANGTAIVASPFPVSWEVQYDGEEWIIGWPNSRYFLDLDCHGLTKVSRTGIQLWRNEDPTCFRRSRVWRLIRMHEIEGKARVEEGDNRAEEGQTRANDSKNDASNTVSETVIDANELGKGLTIVTTTTTTTVTKVVRVQ
ncbi:hypothetical protein BD626DRAFT_396979 [Schizophyllum amplum]|uniref:Ricin B lectin domain-containing protein n=1 Tax=Schizophyllum amplum TaxID=97359 RepID=A0A550CPS5_9AGAR|nr:hypothetical protein BD626DRAFT_396979 [Auriculariopsis ampla]